MVPYAPGITVNDETHGQLKQLSVCLFFYAAGKGTVEEGMKGLGICIKLIYPQRLEIN